MNIATVRQFALQPARSAVGSTGSFRLTDPESSDHYGSRVGIRDRRAIGIGIFRGTHSAISTRSQLAHPTFPAPP